MGNKIYYNCPGCDQRVWAYGPFAGTRCWDCPGTIFSAVTNVTPVVREIKTIASTIIDDRTSYECPSCGKSVWAYGQFTGHDCWECKIKNPAKAMFDIQFSCFEMGGGLGLHPIKSVGGVMVNSKPLIYPSVMKIVETMNEDSAGIKGDGGHHVNVNPDFFDCKVLMLYVRKSDLLPKGTNTAAAIFRVASAPISTLTAENRSFWIEHWWVVLELDNGKYITTYKGPEGIIAKVFSSWYDANSEKNNGMAKENKWVNTVKSCSGNNRTVGEVVAKIKNTKSYYELNGNNCQDYADVLYDWI